MNIFFATPMQHLSHEQKVVVHSTYRDLLATGHQVFLADVQFPTEDTFLSPRESFDFVFDRLKEAEVMVLYYPEKVVTGALVELGLALALGKRVIAVVHNETDLPYMVRQGAPNMSILKLAEKDIRNVTNILSQSDTIVANS